MSSQQSAREAPEAAHRRVGLISIGPATAHDGWGLGPVVAAEHDIAAIGAAMSSLASSCDALLLLDGSFPLPDVALVTGLLDGPCDAWHAGLRLGLEGAPRLLDHVQPCWMLTAPLDPGIEATSWRVSERALLVRSTVIAQLGGLADGFESVAGAALDMGLRWIRAGALVRHVPELAPIGHGVTSGPSHADGLRLVAYHYGRLWAAWSLERGVATGDLRLADARRLARLLRGIAPAAVPHYLAPPRAEGDPGRTVSVILPTLDRYPYLEELLHQLAAQTILPHEVIIVDQTPLTRRRADLREVESTLPVIVIDQVDPGQSTARNAAIGHATGELLLFLDDDDEIGPDLLARHLDLLTDGIDATCGAVDDATAGPPPPAYRHRRVSTTFPTNHTLLRRASLARSGLFDPTFDRGTMEDHDLGMRLHLAGALLVYDPAVMVFHHHASVGGLRTHNARAVTRASARRSLTERNLPNATALYLERRYFTDRQRAASRAVRLLAFLSAQGGMGRRAVRAAVQLVLLPSSIRKMRRIDEAAAVLYARRSPIPELQPARGASDRT